MKINGLEYLRKSWNQYIKTKGALLLDMAPNLIISNILEYKKSLESILNECFENNS